ncbi:radical SAM protein [Crocinitomicaceae bacterium]|nr:radical SAM protein [Crocinitomicaceae bacterium]MDB3907336.1 radical SAM protein [Crocinitomicaceae bacterium]
MNNNQHTAIQAPTMISGARKSWTVMRIWMSISVFIVRKYKSPARFIKIVRRVRQIKKRHNVAGAFKKVAYVDGRIYLSPYNNGWPTRNFNRAVDIEARKAINDPVGNLEQLNTVMIALTKKCPLNCEHCYEGPELNKKDTLTLDDHKKILKKLQNVGIPLIQYGGGDPMAKVNDMVELLKSSDGSSDIWISTSGFNFSKENARRLKDAGLTGISISLDHHEAGEHNKFRRNEKAFDWAMEAAKHAKEVGLVINMSICLTREYTTKENLQSYLELSAAIGASFIQLVEPRAVGNYAGKDVYLRKEHIDIAEQFFVETNADKSNNHLPIVFYPGYHQRKSGCPGAGSKYLYVDTDGYMSSCPFCRNKKTHILEDNTTESSIEVMRNEGCEIFEKYN